MAKKSFKSGMDGLLGSATVAKVKTEKAPEGKRGRPKSNFKEITKTSQVGTRAGETRATFIIDEEQLGKIKALAYWERTSIKEILSEALESFLKEKKGELAKAVNSYKSKAS